MLDPSEAPIVFFNERCVSSGGFLGRFIVSQRYLFSFPHNRRVPKAALFMKVNAFVPRRVIAVLGSVPFIFGVGRKPKIGKSAIRPIHVNMVDLTRWPFSSHVKPSQTVREITSIVYGDYQIPLRANDPARGPAVSSIKMLGRHSSVSPNKDARTGVVMKKLPKRSHADVDFDHYSRLSVRKYNQVYAN